MSFKAWPNTSNVFGDKFLEPLQITDNDFVYKVKQPH